MILTLNILLAVIVVVGIVGLLAYNIHPLRRPLKLDEVAPRTGSTRAVAVPARGNRRGATHARTAQRAARPLDTARA